MTDQPTPKPQATAQAEAEIIAARDALRRAQVILEPFDEDPAIHQVLAMLPASTVRAALTLLWLSDPERREKLPRDAHLPPV